MHGNIPAFVLCAPNYSVISLCSVYSRYYSLANIKLGKIADLVKVCLDDEMKIYFNSKIEDTYVAASADIGDYSMLNSSDKEE